MSGNNISGAYERARERWSRGVILISKRMGRAATRALQISIPLGNRSNRNEFYQTGDLVAFPSLSYLAIYGNMSQKTAQRALDDLEQAGLIRVEHRFDRSNRYYLILPPDAEKGLFEQDERNRKRQRRRKAPDANAPTSVHTHGTMRGGASPKCPPNLDLNPDLRPVSKRHDLASCHSYEDQQGKMVGEEGREERKPVNGSDNHLPSELSQCFIDARQIDGSAAATIIGKAIHQWGRSTEEIREAIDWVKQAGGDANDLAASLWRPDW